MDAHLEDSAPFSNRLEHSFTNQDENLSYAELESLAESMVDHSEGLLYDDTNGDDTVVPDVMLLTVNVYCARARVAKDPNDGASRQEAEASWQPVRDWLGSHSADEVRAAAEQRGECGGAATGNLYLSHRLYLNQVGEEELTTGRKRIWKT